MATVQKKYLTDLMLKEKLPYFKIQDSQNSIRCIAENDDEPDVDTAIDLLEEAISSIEDSYVYVSVSNADRGEKRKGGDVKRYKHYEFRVNLMGSAAKKIGAAEGSAPINKQVLDLLEKNNELQRQIDRLTESKRMDELERQLKELKTQSPIDKLLSNEKFVDGITGMFSSGTKVGLAGAADGEVDEKQVDRLSKLRKSLNRLSKVDKKIDEHIELLADFAEKNSVMYFASIEQVKKMM